MTKHPYDNAVYHDNVYGHALSLLYRHRATLERDESLSIHLDIGCGFGRIAEEITANLGLRYVGIDGADEGPSSLRERGFEAHRMWLESYETAVEGLRSIIDGRKVSFITMLDTLEHLVNGDDILRAIRQIAHEHDSVVVISVPNIAHRDIGFKLTLGRWEYTEYGLLDHTHVRLFTSRSFDQVLRASGLHPIDSEDVLKPKSDQHFPASHTVLADGTLLSEFLRGLRDNIDSFATTNQFVRACVAGPLERVPTYYQTSEPRRPFLSIITRTQGKRLHTLREVFVSLSGQTDTDFEILVIGHRLNDIQRLAVERLIEDNPEWIRHKTRFIRVDDGNRTRPLNVGFESAEGEYIAILDDDDVVFGHWIETFRTLATRFPGRLLRSVALRQNVIEVDISGQKGLRAVGGLEKVYPGEFDFIRHLYMNETPPVSVAFPRGVFHDLNIRFDETLTTTEDWDYILRSALVAGVASINEITSIYRWWENSESSRDVHSQEEWKANHEAIWRKLNSKPILLPAGSVAKICGLLAERGAPEHKDMQIAKHPTTHVSRLSTNWETDVRLEKLQQLMDLYNSASWRITAPIRIIANIFGRPPVRPQAFVRARTAEIEQAIAQVYQSTSWRLTAALRAVGRSVKGRS